MLFNSPGFLLFFPVVTLIYFLLPHRYRWLHLLLASCVFYMSFVPAYILILAAIIVIDYTAALLIKKSVDIRYRRRLLYASFVGNIGVLAVFKYFDFFIQNINSFLSSLHIPVQHLPYLHLILPIGLSFHTFQAMSYTIEVYKGNQEPERHFGIYALYVMFYPQLVAGPIERPQRLLPQFRVVHHFSSLNLLEGLRLMLWGFFKKLVIADRLAFYVNIIFSNVGHYHYLNLLEALLFFSIQIYCDFSGYSDIAVGAARTMGFSLSLNFNRPYYATNIREFWQRWHISLATWFRDYIYFSLGGNKKGTARLYMNIVIVFALSGLWHGANWTFVAWGLLHSAYFLIYLLILRHKKQSARFNSLKNLVGMIITFSAVTLSWIFFRAENIDDSLLLIRQIFTRYSGFPFQLVFNDKITMSYFGIGTLWIAGIATVLMLAVERIFPPDFSMLNKKPALDIAFCSVILSLIFLFGVFHKTSFIYFQF